MDAATATAVAARPPGAGAAIPGTVKAEPHGITFHELLADLNPLQHIPVVGTIYRAVTGDQIPEAARNIGSAVVGGIMGGPIGLAGNLAFLAFRKLTGIDMEQIGQDLLADIGVGHHAAKDGQGTEAPPTQADAAAEPEPQSEGTRTTAWSPAQLKAYGVATDADGSLRQGEVSGSDVLNGLLLAELRSAGGTRPGTERKAA